MPIFRYRTPISVESDLQLSWSAWLYFHFELVIIGAMLLSGLGGVTVTVGGAAKPEHTSTRNRANIFMAPDVAYRPNKFNRRVVSRSPQNTNASARVGVAYQSLSPISP